MDRLRRYITYLVAFPLLAGALAFLPAELSSSEKNRAPDPLAGARTIDACKREAEPARFVSFSRELSRRWQVAFLKDVGKLRSLDAALPRATGAAGTARRLRDAVLQKSRVRLQQTLVMQDKYESKYRDCLDRKTSLDYQSALAYLERQRKNSGLSEEQLQGELADLESMIIARPEHAGMARKAAGKIYGPDLDLIRGEPAAIEETYRQTRLQLAVMERRWSEGSEKYATAESGVPYVNWQQVYSGPLLRGSAVPELEGRQPVEVQEPIEGAGNVLMVGDSIQESMGMYVSDYLPASIRVDTSAGGGYSSPMIYDLFEDAYVPDEHSVVVFDAGTNDNNSLPQIMGEQMESVANVIGPRRCLVLATVNNPTGIGTGPKNETIESFAASRPMTIVVPWAELTSRQPSLLYDGIHPTTEGGQVRARMIAGAIRSCLD